VQAWRSAPDRRAIDAEVRMSVTTPVVADGAFAAGAIALYVAAHVAFTVAVRRQAMSITGSCRFCHPWRWLLLPLPVVGALAALTGIPRMWGAAAADLAEHGLPAPSSTGLGGGLAYAIGRLLLLLPGAQLLALLLQLGGAVVFLAELHRVAAALHTREVAVA
jgi:hypothetical protein